MVVRFVHWIDVDIETRCSLAWEAGSEVEVQECLWKVGMVFSLVSRSLLVTGRRLFEDYQPQQLSRVRGMYGGHGHSHKLGSLEEGRRNPS